MLERYFIRLTTVDRIRACWIGDAIERYVTWLAEQGYGARNVAFRVPVLVRFGEFAKTSGAINWNELPDYVEPFVEHWLKERKHDCESACRIAAREVCNPIQQLLHLIIPNHQNKGRSHELVDPFFGIAPGFFEFLRRDRGLREPTIVQYQHYLRRTECYFRKSGIESLADLSPAAVTALITESGKSLDNRSVQSLCSILKVFFFFRYLYRAGLAAHDLSKQIESPRRYRLADLRRSITWDKVRRMLQAADRRAPVGKRDYTILLLLVTYGLRAREVAALTLDDIDWKRDRLHVRGRKADHSAIYPLAPIVGEAVLDYLQHGRPKIPERALLCRAFAPYTALSRVAVSLRAKHYIRKAGIHK
jgi:integrase/recombinase XerD